MLKNYYQGMIDKQNEKIILTSNLAPMKFVVLFLFVSLFYLNTNAQNFELGKVSVEELNEKVHPNTAAAAAYI
jgi:hypothetical protein